MLMLLINRYNTLNYLLYALIFSLVGGDLLFDFHLFGIHLYAFRIVALLGLIYLVISKQMIFYSNPYEKFVFYFLISWFLYGITSLSWSPDYMQGLKELIYILTGFICYLLVLSMSKRINDFTHKFAKNWLIVFFVVGLFSFNEIMTKMHFISSFSQDIAKFGVAHKINSVPVFTFDNPNHFAVYLMFTLFIALFLLINQIQIRLPLLAIFLISFFVYFIESRLSYLVICVFVLVVAVFLIGKYFTQIQKGFSYLLQVSVFFVSFFLMGLGFMSAQKIIKEKHPMSRVLVVDSEFEKDKNNFKEGLRSKTDAIMYMDTRVERRIRQLNESVECRLFNVHPGHKGSWLTAYLFPLISFLLLLIVTLFGIFKKSKTLSFKLSITVMVGIILIGIVWRHPLTNVNEKWNSYIIVESEKGVEKLSLNLVESSKIQFTPVSLHGRTVQSLFSGRGVMLKMHQSIEVPGLTSEAIRKNLFFKGIKQLITSSFIGVGAGGFSFFSNQYNNKFDTGTVDSPHSLFVEIFSQYGILIALVFVIVLSVPLYAVCRDLMLFRFSRSSLMLFLLIFCFALMSNSNSSSIPLPIIWINFSLIVIFFNDIGHLRHLK